MVTEGYQVHNLVLWGSGISGIWAIEIQMGYCFFSVFDPVLRLKGLIGFIQGLLLPLSLWSEIGIGTFRNR